MPRSLPRRHLVAVHAAAARRDTDLDLIFTRFAATYPAAKEPNGGFKTSNAVRPSLLLVGCEDDLGRAAAEDPSTSQSFVASTEPEATDQPAQVAHTAPAKGGEGGPAPERGSAHPHPDFHLASASGVGAAGRPPGHEGSARSSFAAVHTAKDRAAAVAVSPSNGRTDDGSSASSGRASHSPEPGRAALNFTVQALVVDHRYVFVIPHEETVR